MQLQWKDSDCHRPVRHRHRGGRPATAKKPKTSEDYFLANRQLRRPFIGESLYASGISAEHLVGLAGSGFLIGMAFGGFEWMAVFCMAPLRPLFLPFYLQNKIFTIPEFLERRFDPSVRLLLSGFMVVLSVLTKISISLWAFSLVFQELLGWNQNAVIWIVGLATAIYTIKGGLKVVVATDAIQTAILLVSAVVLTVIGLNYLGDHQGPLEGWRQLHAKLGPEHPEMFHMVGSATDPDVPWPGMFFGVFIIGCFYWCMDQVLVQRVFAAKDLNEGRKGVVFCGFLKILNPFILVVPGLIARALFPDIGKDHSDLAYPRLLEHLMPAGLLGLTVAGITAALMGHLSATYNSVATLFTRDFYLLYRPNANHERQIFVGRFAILAVFVLGALQRTDHRPLQIVVRVSANHLGLSASAVRRRLLPRRPLETNHHQGRFRFRNYRLGGGPCVLFRRPYALSALVRPSFAQAVFESSNHRTGGLRRGAGEREPLHRAASARETRHDDDQLGPTQPVRRRRVRRLLAPRLPPLDDPGLGHNGRVVVCHAIRTRKTIIYGSAS